MINFFGVQPKRNDPQKRKEKSSFHLSFPTNQNRNDRSAGQDFLRVSSMAHSPSAHLCPFTVIPQSGKCLGKCCNIREASLLHGRDQSPGHSPLPARLVITKTKATRDDRNSKPKSMICANCDGNGAVLCSQCKGDGINSEDMFNGRFKAGDSCWLCGGRREMLCGSCNGAGFIGGFMSTFDE
ncbi:hypothetical protein SAY87_026087 [Trapa incisa]|uniref:BSD2 cysteine rich domain-containing protein n=1 Tax=Trapa incisa TaxID=236973 RepID=A0AAN7GIX1_9MYRT|nr:hypothetical protein SAY87_026087 [Trapa incisa]